MLKVSFALLASSAAALDAVAAVYDPARDAFTAAPLQALDADPAAGETARCGYEDSFLKTGWDLLDCRGLEGAADPLMARGAGFAEGFLTAASIEDHARNTGADTWVPSDSLAQYLELNEQYMDAQQRAAEQHGSEEQRTYWWQVRLVREQLAGVFEGYMASPHRNLSQPLTYDAISYMNLGGDLEDLADVFQETENDGPTPIYGPGRCSALVKLLDDHSDAFVAQVTWSSLNEMMRAYKMYDLPYSLHADSDEPVAARRVALSSYPANLFSGDDHYSLSSGLVVMETTIGYSNRDLDAFIQPASVLEWTRNIVANRLAASGASWAAWFEKENSGTYNNANMVFDQNKFVKGAALAPETLMLVEQVPGFVVSTDLSQLLQDQGYFPSFNTAYDPWLRNITGVDADEEQFGDFYDYEKNPRAQIFRRDQGNIRNLDDMKHMMRYNDFTNDPLSSQMETCEHIGMTDCSPWYTPENTISTRGDLADPNGTYALSAFGLRNHVGTDAKIAVVSEFDPERLPVHAVCGPTNDQQPTFVWSQSYYKDVPHYGHPDVFDFDYEEIAWPLQ